MGKNAKEWCKFSILIFIRASLNTLIYMLKCAKSHAIIDHSLFLIFPLRIKPAIILRCKNFDPKTLEK